MKRVQGQATENTFGFEVLTSEEMNMVKGGIDTPPKSRTKDIWDIEEE